MKNSVNDFANIGELLSNYNFEENIESTSEENGGGDS